MKEFEFETRAEVIDETKGKGVKAVLTILIALSLFTMLVELLLNGEFKWGFVIPLLILIPARKKAGVKSCVQDVQGRAVDNVNEIVILLFNAVKTKKGTLNRRLTVRKEEGTYSWDEGSMQFAAKVNGKIELVDSTNAVAAVEELNSEWIYLYLEEEYLEKFRQLFAFSTEIKDEFREEE